MFCSWQVKLSAYCKSNKKNSFKLNHNIGKKIIRSLDDISSKILNDLIS